MSLATIDHFGDVPVGIQVELGRRTMTLRNILDLQPGSLISTTKRLGDDLVVLAEGIRLGCGEVIVKGESVAVRLTEIGEAR